MHNTSVLVFNSISSAIYGITKIPTARNHSIGKIMTMMELLMAQQKVIEWVFLQVTSVGCLLV